MPSSHADKIPKKRKVIDVSKTTVLATRLKDKDKRFLEYLMSIPKEDVLRTLEYAQKNYADKLSKEVWTSIQNTVSNYLGTKKAFEKVKVVPDRIKELLGDIEPELLLSMIKQESRFNPKAKSSVGAVGLMQLMPLTAKQMGLKSSERANPLKNVQAGLGYIKWLKDTYDITETKDLLHAYNTGPGGWKKGRKPDKNYITNILKNYRNYKENPTEMKKDLDKLEGILYPKKVSLFKVKKNGS